MTVAQCKPSFPAWPTWLRPSRSQPLSRFVGIALGVESASVVTLGSRHCDQRRSCQRAEKLRWLTRCRFALPVDPLAAPPPDWVDRVISSLKEQLPRSVDGDQNIAALALPLPWVHYQVVPAAELESSRLQCDSMFASSLFQSNAHLGYWPLQANSLAGPDAPYVIAAIAESAAYDVAEAVCSLGYQIESIVPQGVALADAAEPMTTIDPQCIVVLDRCGGLIAMNHQGGCGLCRALPAIPNQLLAESRLRGLSLDAIRPWLSEIAAEITATRRYVQRGQAAQAVKPLLLCGDLASLPQLDEILASLIDVPVARWRYTGHSRPGEGLTLEQAGNTDLFVEDVGYAVALSLAYAAVESVSTRGMR